MTANMTVCPDCDEPFDTVEQEQDLPIQTLRQVCPECETELIVGIINYPATYTVIGPALDGETCEKATRVGAMVTDPCGRDAVVRTQRVGQPVEALCESHSLGMYDTARGLLSE